MTAVTITLTREQWLAIWRCAGCAADTYDDAISVLGSAARVAALNRGMAKLERAIFAAKAAQS